MGGRGLCRFADIDLCKAFGTVNRTGTSGREAGTILVASPIGRPGGGEFLAGRGGAEFPDEVGRLGIGGGLVLALACKYPVATTEK